MIVLSATSLVVLQIGCYPLHKTDYMEMAMKLNWTVGALVAIAINFPDLAYADYNDNTVTPETAHKKHSVLTNVQFVNAGQSSITKQSRVQKSELEKFARTVTNHLLDTSYISYRRSTIALTKELALVPVQQMLVKAGMLALRANELDAQEKTLQELHQVSSVRIDDVQVGDPDANRRGLIPIAVRGMATVHSTHEGTANPQPFHFKYWVESKSDPEEHPATGVDNKPWLIVAYFEDLSGQPSTPPNKTKTAK
jgi:hypothetical protein